MSDLTEEIFALFLDHFVEQCEQRFNALIRTETTESVYYRDDIAVAVHQLQINGEIKSYQEIESATLGNRILEARMKLDEEDSDHDDADHFQEKLQLIPRAVAEVIQD